MVAARAKRPADRALTRWHIRGAKRVATEIVARPDLSEQAARLVYGTTEQQVRAALLGDDLLTGIFDRLPSESREALRWSKIRKSMGAGRFLKKYEHRIDLDALDVQLRDAEERVTAALYRRFGEVPSWSVLWLERPKIAP